MKNKNIFIYTFVGVILIGGYFGYSILNNDTAKLPGGAGVFMENGKQIIDITAKGGYSPRVVTAKAGVPTIIRMKTSGTYDCSSSLVIPKLNYRKALLPTGEEEIEITASQAQGTLQGLCSMGMYGFKVVFE